VNLALGRKMTREVTEGSGGKATRRSNELAALRHVTWWEERWQTKRTGGRRAIGCAKGRGSSMGTGENLHELGHVKICGREPWSSVRTGKKGQFSCTLFLSGGEEVSGKPQKCKHRWTKTAGQKIVKGGELRTKKNKKRANYLLRQLSGRNKRRGKAEKGGSAWTIQKARKYPEKTSEMTRNKRDSLSMGEWVYDEAPRKREEIIHNSVRESSAVEGKLDGKVQSNAIKRLQVNREGGEGS